MNLETQLRSVFAASAAAKLRAAETLALPLAQASERLVARLRMGHRVLACGNGGSAGDAQHLASELVNRFEQTRQALPAIALTTDSSVLTAIANDDCYERVFARQVEALGRSGDCLVAITTSGNSASVLQAVTTAQARGMWVLALTGRDGGKLAALLRPDDLELRVPDNNTARIQEVHLLLIHGLCLGIDAAFVQSPAAARTDSAAKVQTDWQALAELLAGRRPLVFTNGVFDILHRGHVGYLEEARAEGVCLVVGVNSDASVRRLGKGADRPINPQAERMAVLAGLAAVDFVTVFDQDTPLRLIESLTPDVLVKGGDWPVAHMVGADLVQARGGRALSIPFRHECSTTALLQRIREEQS
ncbi:MAG: D-glycero-beta-D-manno-heptose 1-phosphate adenylyltransferase [Acidithiobacillus sp.]